MSSFFTTPRSQKRRKISGQNPASSKSPNTSKPTTATNRKPGASQAQRDESISSESEDNLRESVPSDEEPIEENSSDENDETAAERRLRLAEGYLKNLKGEVEEDIGFDAEQIDKDLIAERLQEDVAETKGRLYRNIASTLDFSQASKTRFRADTLTTTGVAVCAPYAYTASKDISLIKWELPIPSLQPKKPPKRPQKPVRRRPFKLITIKGDKSKAADSSYMRHTGPILCVAASTTGKFVATGGADNKMIVYSHDLVPLKVFTQHRDAVTALTFRRSTNQLYSASKDRTVKVWSLDELAYVETLFGHQDEVVDVASLNLERVISVGARDRTARLWKVVEETQLVFRGGGTSEKRRFRNSTTGDSASTEIKSYSEGSIDRVVMIDEETFCTASDNGSISLWNVQKKKPIYTVSVAHGLEPALTPEEASADADPSRKVPDPQPRWITALAGVPFSDLLLSGSWDGEIRVWKVSADKKRLEAMGCIMSRVDPVQEEVKEGTSKNQDATCGVINDLDCFERGNRGLETLCIVASQGTEHRLGRWKCAKGKNGAVVLEVPRLTNEEAVGEAKPEDVPDVEMGKQ